jgi:Ca2+-binding RTX toxin-like protein
MAIKFGTNGKDNIPGTNGDDYLLGLGDDDILSGGAGADNLDGGDGNDAVSYEDSPVGVVVSIYTNQAFSGDAEGDTLYDIENLWGSRFNDVLVGDDHANVLLGNEGKDVLVGHGGADWLAGGPDDDQLFGGVGFDWLFGADGNDRLYGGEGFDMLFGGPGADTFVWTDTAEFLAGTDTANFPWLDQIMDFDRAQGDLIDLSAIDFYTHARGDQAFTFIGTAEFSGKPGEIRYVQGPGATYIAVSTDADVANEGAFLLLGTHTPDASWFVL